MTFIGWAIHVVPPNGGGVDRHVRDICSQRPQDSILHAVEDVLILEHPAGGQTYTLSTKFERQLIASLLGQPALIHAHSTLKATRIAVALLCTAANCPFVLTLHDTDFALGMTDAADKAEGRERLSFLGRANAVMAPSQFICQIANSTLQPANACRYVENGVSALPPNIPSAPFARREGLEGSFSVAVVGALGQHKGLRFLMDVASKLPQAIKVVVIGYADGQLTSGWMVPDRIWVHGPFEPCELAHWIRVYGVQLALFPNRQPESYCYALSDAWSVGLPVIVPNQGALEERVVKHGGGWLYPQDAPAEKVALIVEECLSNLPRMREQVALAAAELKSVEEMVHRIEAVYKGQALNQAGSLPDVAGLSKKPRVHLDSRLFRKELLRLAGEITDLKGQQDRTLQELQKLSTTSEQRGEWIAKQQEAIEQLKQELERVEGLRLTEHQEALEISNELSILNAKHMSLQADYVKKAEVAREYVLIQERLARLTVWMPPLVRRQMYKLLGTVDPGGNSR